MHGDRLVDSVFGFHSFDTLKTGPPTNGGLPFSGSMTFVIFILLQALDITTTLIVLHGGGSEANPMVNKLMGIGPVAGLAIAKVLAVVVGALVVWRGHGRALRAANYIYAGVICWNLITLAVLR